MYAEHDRFYNLAERIEDAYFEIDNDMMTDLLEINAEYIALHQEIKQMEADFPILVELTDGSGAISLSAEEHKAFVEHFLLEQRRENIERQYIYFRGHRDNYHYMKKIGAI